MNEPKAKFSDYFAELYVAGRLADAGWNIYFPHRDEGFDFIISKSVSDQMVIRPVQVKGKYPSGDKGDKVTYGYVGKLTQVHPEMVLAIAFFSAKSKGTPPVCIAYLPPSLVKKHSRGYRCEPSSFKNGEPKPRRDYAMFFDDKGVELLESKDWKGCTLALRAGK